MKLASEYSANFVFFEQLQKNIRKINSDCNFETKCFEDNSKQYFEKQVCPDFEKHNFVSEKECIRAGQSVMDLVSGKTEFAVPIRDTAQDAHNNRMYELEQKRLEYERERQGIRRSKRCGQS